MTTAETADVKIKPGVGNGNYLVLLDGEKVGEVQKIKERYNIAPRSLTVISWRATPVGQQSDPTNYSTRRDAVRALIERNVHA